MEPIVLLWVFYEYIVETVKDGFDMFNDPLVWKQPCASEKDVDNLPVLKYAIIDKLKGK